MTRKSLFLAVALVLSSFAIDSFALLAEPTRLVLWRRGESIAGEEFLAANEAIVDYLATLPRPTDILKGFKYNCTVKSRSIRPSVQHSPTSNAEWVPIRMVYELKDCTAAP